MSRSRRGRGVGAAATAAGEVGTAPEGLAVAVVGLSHLGAADGTIGDAGGCGGLAGIGFLCTALRQVFWKSPGAHRFQKGVRAFAVLIALARVVVEVAFPLDFRVLQGVDPAVELAGDGLALRRDGVDFRLLCRQAVEKKGEAEHGARLAGGAARDVEEVDAVGGCAALEALGNVVGDGKDGTSNLVHKVATELEQRIGGEAEDIRRQADGGVPNGKVFEALVLGHGSPFEVQSSEIGVRR